MTRAEYILAHAPTILAGMLGRSDNTNFPDIYFDLAIDLAGRLWDEVDPTRQTRSVKDEVGYKTAVEDCIASLQMRYDSSPPMSQGSWLEAIKEISKFK